MLGRKTKIVENVPLRSLIGRRYRSFFTSLVSSAKTSAFTASNAASPFHTNSVRRIIAISFYETRSHVINLSFKAGTE